MISAGTAFIDITPPPGSLMACFPVGPERTPRRAVGAHDPLFARVLALSDGRQTAAICACDLAIIRRIDVARIREQVTADARVLVCATHTHSSPESGYLFGNTPDDPWVVETDRRIAAAVDAACRAMAPVTLSAGSRDTELSHNRRVPGGTDLALEYCEGETTGPVDPALTVLRLDGADGPRALLCHFTAHALTVGPRTFHYTADYPGAIVRALEERFPGAAALFVNGAAGNVHPRRCMRQDLSALQEMGAALGEAAINAAGNAATLGDLRLDVRAETLTFPNRMDSALQVDVELACLDLGPLTIGFVPGELFVEFQLEFKRRLAPRTALLIGYANGWPGYIPTRDAYPAGGYGVDPCPTDPPALSRTALPPGAGEEILERLVKLSNATE